MATVDVDGSSHPADRVGGHLALSLHSPNVNPARELSQWPEATVAEPETLSRCHCDAQQGLSNCRALDSPSACLSVPSGR